MTRDKVASKGTREQAGASEGTKKKDAPHRQVLTMGSIKKFSAAAEASTALSVCFLFDN